MKTVWNKGKKMPHSPEWEANRLKAIRVAASKRVYPKGYKRPIAHTKPMRDAMIAARKADPERFRKLYCSFLPKDCKGEKNGNWKGGITEKMMGPRFSRLYREWRKIVIKRDNGICRLCKTDQKIEAHHIVAVSECPSIIYLPMNGVALCRKCHYENDAAWQGKRFTPYNPSGKIQALFFTIPHMFHSYPTVGNWQFNNDGALVIFISELSNKKYEFLLTIHEYVEAMSCKFSGITVKQVDDFDLMFEKKSILGKVGDTDEPGDESDCPYKKQHCIATGIERILACQIGVDWKTYEKELSEMPYPQP